MSSATGCPSASLVLVATADEIGVAVRPVVELHGGEVEAPGEVDDRSRVAVGPVVGDEPVAQSTARIVEHLHGRAGDDAVTVQLDPVATRWQRAERDRRSRVGRHRHGAHVVAEVEHRDDPGRHRPRVPR